MDQNVITKEEFFYNMLHLHGIKLKRESMPNVVKHLTTLDMELKDVPVIGAILRASEKSFDFSDTPDLEEMRRLNSIVDHGREDWMEGELRNTAVKVPGSDRELPVPDKDKINKDIDAILQLKNDADKAVEMLLYIMKTHIFYDGNKRIAQLIASEILKKHDMVLSIPVEHQDEFIALLKKYYEDKISKNEIKKFIKENALFERSGF